ncbi:MAG: UDP-N-acetylglucosamine--N-acetylmuramyl-(pentapeptide) pyrophosphoryl-undecaprenol N-acetylglucosamine transferase [Patescibacteria group bacterium]|jgi:UDP-N-acetylglucosamine--N-acetylmuramyl-(pentapeptide) pyrophosphoryl-undecaprenol N-acetylglucosamine transferase
MRENKKQKIKILFTGGGTGGSVSPLLAVFDELESYKVHKVESKKEFEYLWVGTRFGPEREMVEKAGIKFIAISSGKLRRYFSIHNFLDPFKIIAGFFKSLLIISRFRPDLIMTAGSFSSVPIIWAGWLLGVKILVHQQDVRPGLANKLMAPFANVITVAFEESLKYFGKKAVCTGNPCGFPIDNFRLTNDKIFKKFGLKKDLPVVLIVGGGTGAEGINKLVWGSLDELTKISQIVHITGKNKIKDKKEKIKNYLLFDFVEHDKLMLIMKMADLVVSRAGLGFLTEIYFLAKPAILIPMPDSHQEDNARVFSEKKGAIILDQIELTPEIFSSKIKDLLNNEKLRYELGNNAGKVMKRGANEEIIRVVNLLLFDQ